MNFVRSEPLNVERFFIYRLPSEDVFVVFLIAIGETELRLNSDRRPAHYQKRSPAKPAAPASFYKPKRTVTEDKSEAQAGKGDLLTPCSQRTPPHQRDDFY